MLKEKMIHRLSELDKKHLLWVHRIRDLLEGAPLDEDMIDLDPKECPVGKWLEHEASKFKEVPFFSEVMEDLEAAHLKLHEIYFDIYRIYFVENIRKGIPALFLGERKKLEYEQIQEVLGYFEELLKASEKLSGEIYKLQRKIKISQDSTIVQYYSVEL